VTPSLVDPEQCEQGSSAWVGETRHPGPPPPPPPPPAFNWNLQPNLLPPTGMWRGATIDKRFAAGQPDNQTRAFEAAFDTKLHIYRTFKTETWTEITPGEQAFVAGGGILFYSIEPRNWTEWVDWHAAWKIKRFAAAIRAVAPAKVMVAPGYEADGHAEESQNKSQLVYGKAAEYKAMFRNFVRTFRKENVTNAVWVLDLSSNARNDAVDIFPQLYAGDEYVDWCFFNLFQSHKQSPPPEPTRGNCTTIATMQCVYHPPAHPTPAAWPVPQQLYTNWARPPFPLCDPTLSQSDTSSSMAGSVHV
jgi:hypothetical protein